MSKDSDSSTSRLWKPSSWKLLLGIPLGGFLAFGLGAVALGSLNWTLHETGQTEFCYVCHSHENFIRPEYEASTHFANTSGVQAGCSSCHLPHDNWFELVWTKAVVSLDIIPELAGKLDTAEKYESHRAEMAEAVWRQFKENDSRFCRDCHKVDRMDLESQSKMAGRRHASMAERGQTCIDCHAGVVHALPENHKEILKRIDEEFAANK